jgi:hypothetical protein
MEQAVDQRLKSSAWPSSAKWIEGNLGVEAVNAGRSSIGWKDEAALTQADAATFSELQDQLFRMVGWGDHRLSRFVRSDPRHESLCVLRSKRCSHCH